MDACILTAAELFCATHNLNTYSSAHAMRDGYHFSDWHCLISFVCFHGTKFEKSLVDFTFWEGGPESVFQL